MGWRWVFEERCIILCLYSQMIYKLWLFRTTFWLSRERIQSDVTLNESIPFFDFPSIFFFTTFPSFKGDCYDLLLPIDSTFDFLLFFVSWSPCGVILLSFFWDRSFRRTKFCSSQSRWSAVSSLIFPTLLFLVGMFQDTPFNPQT